MKFFSLLLMSTLMFGYFSYPETAYAQEAIVLDEMVVESPSLPSLEICKDEAGVPKACDNKDVLDHLFVSIGGYKGMTSLGIAFVIAKFLLLLLLSPFFSLKFPSLLRGDVKLLVATGLNLIVGVISLMMPPVGLAFGAAIVHSSTLALASVFGNQAFKQFLTAKGKK